MKLGSSGKGDRGGDDVRRGAGMGSSAGSTRLADGLAGRRGLTGNDKKIEAASCLVCDTMQQLSKGWFRLVTG